MSVSERLLSISILMGGRSVPSNSQGNFDNNRDVACFTHDSVKADQARCQDLGVSPLASGEAVATEMPDTLSDQSASKFCSFGEW